MMTGNKKRNILNMVVITIVIMSIAAWWGMANIRQLLAPADDLATIALFDLQGQPVDIARFSDQPMVVNYWATWCAPCLKEFPEFELARQDHESRVHFVMISDEPPEKLRHFVDTNPYGFTFLRTARPLSEHGKTMRPLTYFYSAGLRMRSKFAGSIGAEELEKEIGRIL